jgi:hypothetical protein
MSNLARIRLKLRPMAVALPHWLSVVLIALGTAFVTGLGAYIQQVPLSQWLAAAQNPKQLIPLAVGALVGGLSALLAQGLLLLKQWASNAPPSLPSNPLPPDQT